MTPRLIAPAIALFFLSSAHADTFNPTGTYTGTMMMTDVKKISDPVECPGSIGIPFEVRYRVKARNGKVTVNDTRNIVRRGTVLAGSKFKAKAVVNDFVQRWTYTVTGTKITRTKGTITEIIRRQFVNDPLARGCEYTYFARDLKRTK